MTAVDDYLRRHPTHRDIRRGVRQGILQAVAVLCLIAVVLFFVGVALDVAFDWTGTERRARLLQKMIDDASVP